MRAIALGHGAHLFVVLLLQAPAATAEGLRSASLAAGAATLLTRECVRSCGVGILSLLRRGRPFHRRVSNKPPMGSRPYRRARTSLSISSRSNHGGSHRVF